VGIQSTLHDARLARRMRARAPSSTASIAAHRTRTTYTGADAPTRRETRGNDDGARGRDARERSRRSTRRRDDETRAERRARASTRRRRSVRAGRDVVPRGFEGFRHLHVRARSRGRCARASRVGSERDRANETARASRVGSERD
jgi:hypothetical protein